MSHRSKRIHTFKCDDDGCSHAVEIRNRSKRGALKSVRRDGWSAHSGDHYCPTHNTKETLQCPECGSVLIKKWSGIDAIRCRSCGHRWEP